jgi:hypothetical protein
MVGRGEPIWVTAVKQGRIANAWLWPGVTLPMGHACTDGKLRSHVDATQCGHRASWPNVRATNGPVSLSYPQVDTESIATERNLPKSLSRANSMLPWAALSKASSSQIDDLEPGHPSDPYGEYQTNRLSSWKSSCRRQSRLISLSDWRVAH